MDITLPRFQQRTVPIADPLAWAPHNITKPELDEVMPQFSTSDVRQRHVHLAARTILCGAGGLMPSTTNGATDTGKIEIGAQHDYYVLDFPDGSKTYATFLISDMPANYDGRGLTARFGWTVNSTSTNPCVFGCQLLGLANGSALSASLGTAQTVADASDGTANHYAISAYTPLITPGGTAAGGNGLLVVVYRDATDGGDTLAATVRLLGVKLIYQTRAFGDA